MHRTSMEIVTEVSMVGATMSGARTTLRATVLPRRRASMAIPIADKRIKAGPFQFPLP